MNRRSLLFKCMSLLAGMVIPLLFLWSCSRPALRPSPPPAKVVVKRMLPRLGYTIQAGAFASAENGARLSLFLQEKGLAATYFGAGGLYKVRFGNFPTKEQARLKAEEVREAGLIEEFYIVTPEEHPVSQRAQKGEAYLREELVRFARSFLGVPYLWGGASAEKGFDCSGLTMTVYQLGGFDLPRTSGEQYIAGNPVDPSSVEKGDLVFFAAPGGDKVTHVGIYAGKGQFIHAPERGKRIRTDSLSNSYFRRAYIGARSYL